MIDFCSENNGLLQECKSGVWFMAAASASFLLQQGPGDADGEELWHEALSLMGGDYAALSKAMEGGRDDNIMDLVRGEDSPDEDEDQ